MSEKELDRSKITLEQWQINSWKLNEASQQAQIASLKSQLAEREGLIKEIDRLWNMNHIGIDFMEELKKIIHSPLWPKVSHEPGQDNTSPLR